MALPRGRGALFKKPIKRGTNQLDCLVDAVSLSAVATDDIEVGFGIELRALLR